MSVPISFSSSAIQPHVVSAMSWSPAAPVLVVSLVKVLELFAATTSPSAPLAAAYCTTGQTSLPGLICWLIAFCS